MSVRIQADVDVNAGPASRAVAALSQNFNKLAINSNTSTRRLQEHAKAIVIAQKAAESETRVANANALAQERVNKARKEANLVVARTAGVRSDTSNRQAIAEGEVALKQARAQSEEVRSRAVAEDAADRIRSRNLRDQIALQKEQERLARQTARAEEERYQALVSMRYAMYDISRHATLIAAALGTAFVAPVAVAVSMEREFANVLRTVDAASGEVKNLRADFSDLYRALPISWEDLTNIGSLAGQLGIGSEYIADFTEQVAKFTATTDVSVEDAATAFGRLNSLVPGVDNNFQGLADSIANVGNNSIATESQIIRIATQLSTLATTANFSYESIVGLAASLASVGVPPELSRGLTTRVFGQLTRALSDGGVALENWARIAGMSGEQFRAAWSRDSAATFIQFMDGIRTKGGGAEAAIRQLGITSVRDVPVLIRLANAADQAGNAGGLLAEQFGYAADAAGAMDEEFGVIADTAASKLQRVQNSVALLVEAMGGQALEPFKAVLDVILSRLEDLSSFVESDFGKVVVVIGAVVAALGAVLAIITAVGTMSLAGFAALITALRQLQLASGGATLSMGTMLTMLAATGPAGKAAAVGIRVLTVAMRALTAATLLLALPDVASTLRGWGEDMRGLDRDFEATAKRLSELGTRFEMTKDVTKGAGIYGTDVVKQVRKEIQETETAWQKFISQDTWMQDWQRTMANSGLGGPGPVEDIKRIDDALSSLAMNQDWKGVIEGLNIAAKGSGISMADMLKVLDGTDAALTEAGYTIKQTADGLYVLKGATDETVVATNALSEAEQEASDARAESLKSWADADATFLNIGTIYSSMIEKQKELAQETADGTDDMADSWQTYFDGVTINLDDYLANLQKSIDAQTNWEQNMFTLRERGASDAVIEELRKLGEEGAPLVQSFVDGTSEQLQEFNRIMSEGGEEGGLAFATGIIDASPDFLARVRELGDEAAGQIIAGLAAGTLTVQQVTEEMLSPLTNAQIQLVINADTAPVISDFDDVKAYAEALQIWMQARGQTEPARADYNSVKEYAEALQIWMKTRANTLGAIADIQDVKAQGEALTTYMRVYADVSNAEATVQQFTSKQRYAYIQAQLVNPDGGRPINAGQFANGGTIRGPGTATSDTAGLFALSNGEEVIRARMAERYRPILKAINAGTYLGGLATGGTATASRTASYAAYGARNNQAAVQAANASRTTMVELSPTDRELLRTVGSSLEVVIPGQFIGRASNAYNKREFGRGSA